MGLSVTITLAAPAAKHSIATFACLMRVPELRDHKNNILQNRHPRPIYRLCPHESEIAAD